jgi:hypothetical protein
MGNTPPHCAARTRSLFNEIWPLLQHTHTCNFPDNGHSFRIFLVGSDYGISIAVPPDCNPISNTRVTYETALWSVADNNLAYNDEWGYDDVCRFDTHEEVVAEIHRLFNLTLQPSMS